MLVLESVLESEKLSQEVQALALAKVPVLALESVPASALAKVLV